MDARRKDEEHGLVHLHTFPDDIDAQNKASHAQLEFTSQT